MSTLVPTLGTWEPPATAPVPTGPVPTITSSASPISWLPAFEPRRSRLLSWPVRIAQLADRLATRSSHAPAADRAPGRGWTQATLTGLDCCCRLAPRHRTSLRAERAVVHIRQVIDRRRDVHRRFRVLRQAMPRNAAALPEATRRLHLNPAHCWIRGDLPLPATTDRLPTGSVLFFLDENLLRGLHLQLEGQVLINELADYQPCTIDQWARLSPLVDAPQLRELARYLATVGLVAWE